MEQQFHRFPLCFFFSIVFIFLCTDANVNAQNARTGMSVESRIRSVEYCSAWHLRLLVEIRLTNTSETDILFFKNEVRPVSKYIAKNKGGLNQKKSRIEGFYTYNSYWRHQMEPNSAADDEFKNLVLAIEPHKTATLSRYISVSIANEKSLSNNGVKLWKKGRLPPGTYFVKVNFGTWFSSDDPKKAREKFKNRGLLWTDGFSTEALEFKVDKMKIITGCKDDEVEKIGV